VPGNSKSLHAELNDVIQSTILTLSIDLLMDFSS